MRLRILRSILVLCGFYVKVETDPEANSRSLAVLTFFHVNGESDPEVASRTYLRLVKYPNKPLNVVRVMKAMLPSSGS